MEAKSEKFENLSQQSNILRCMKAIGHNVSGGVCFGISVQVAISILSGKLEEFTREFSKLNEIFDKNELKVQNGFPDYLDDDDSYIEEAKEIKINFLETLEANIPGHKELFKNIYDYQFIDEKPDNTDGVRIQNLAAINSLKDDYQIPFSVCDA